MINLAWVSLIILADFIILLFFRVHAVPHQSLAQALLSATSMMLSALTLGPHQALP